ncbi:putative holin-like toxin [Bacillus swezeyi]
MAVESAIQLMFTFGILIVAIMSSDKKSKTVLAAKLRRSYS